MSAPAILDPRAAWLARRRELVTASDAASILGAGRRSPFAVWAEKVGEIETEDNVDMARGQRFEGVIADEYALQTGRPVFTPADEHEITIHPDLPWLGATLDRRTLDPTMPAARGEGPLQIKMAIGSARDWKDEPPLGYLVQVQIESACSRSLWGALAALVGPGPLKVVDLERDDAFLRVAIPRLEEFHWRVVNRRPPEADGSASTTAALKALYGAEDGGTVELDAAALADVEAWEAHDILVQAEAEQAEAARNRLRARLGGASFGRLPDGTFLSLNVTKRRGYTPAPVAPTTYRTLRRVFPRMKGR